MGDVSRRRRILLDTIPPRRHAGERNGQERAQQQPLSVRSGLQLRDDAACQGLQIKCCVAAPSVILFCCKLRWRLAVARSKRRLDLTPQSELPARTARTGSSGCSCLPERDTCQRRPSNLS